MSARIANPFVHAGASMKAAVALERSYAESGVEQKLLGLVRLRAAQMNGCAFCIHAHVVELQKLGETDMRMHMVAGWREATDFSPRERAALGWTEALTLVAETHAPDDVYEAFKSEFGEEEQVVISMVIGTVNLWNRLQIGFRVPPAG
ncbi:carboxymuconolactone decarboxylase family protein [Sphingomonas sp. BK235]|uniref:carboxymuconolactone decarboxylase family protein n=1 Tax=Sphingomonas sp. BK235 TaxID=2512131 RepID=UPI0010442E41|nr:carboxymuconolactone decarboxylase family protein [Sphingomonas sp. BK235]TCP36077.1 AhpD family alkylhydroperoxidase [Sphingomonas sp. BK235]